MHAESMTVEQIRNGAVIEMINNELQTVYNDVANPNKEAKSARKVTVDLVFNPSEDGAAVTDEVVADVADATGTASEDADSTSEVSGESANSTGDGIEAEEARE